MSLCLEMETKTSDTIRERMRIASKSKLQIVHQQGTDRGPDRPVVTIEGEVFQVFVTIGFLKLLGLRRLRTSANVFRVNNRPALRTAPQVKRDNSRQFASPGKVRGRVSEQAMSGWHHHSCQKNG